jgi:hypothetical protein
LSDVTLRDLIGEETAVRKAPMSARESTQRSKMRVGGTHQRTRSQANSRISVTVGGATGRRVSLRV